MKNWCAYLLNYMTEAPELDPKPNFQGKNSRFEKKFVYSSKHVLDESREVSRYDPPCMQTRVSKRTSINVFSSFTIYFAEWEGSKTSSCHPCEKRRCKE